MAVYAITTILRGVKGEVKEFKVGDSLDGFSDDELRGLIDGGSAVETGKSRKFTAEPSPATAADEETRKRDELLAKANMAVEDDANVDATAVSPGAALAAGAPAAQTGGSTTIQQAASDQKNS